jgi:hypothetical protein
MNAIAPHEHDRVPAVRQVLARQAFAPEPEQAGPPHAGIELGDDSHLDPATGYLCEQRADCPCEGKHVLAGIAIEHRPRIGTARPHLVEPSTRDRHASCDERARVAVVAEAVERSIVKLNILWSNEPEMPALERHYRNRSVRFHLPGVSPMSGAGCGGGVGAPPIFGRRGRFAPLIPPTASRSLTLSAPKAGTCSPSTRLPRIGPSGVVIGRFALRLAA